MHHNFIKSILVLLLFFTGTTNCIAQIKEEKVIYRGFPEGVYLNVGQFILRKPYIEKEEMLTGNNSTPTSIRSWVKRDSLYFKKANGQKTTLKIDSIWAVFEGGILYVQKNQLIHKVSTFGMLSMFYETFPLVQAPFNPVASEQTRKETPRLLDLETGKIINYSTDVMKNFLKLHDETLYIQFIALKNNKMRKKQLFHFIELYNEYHPIL